MSRQLLATFPLAGLLGLTSAALGAGHFLAVEQATPRGLVRAWATAAEAGDLTAMDTLASGSALAPGVEALGGAWHSRVGAAYKRAAIAGALHAYQVHLRWDEARSDARRAFYDIPWRSRPDPRDPWIEARALEALSEADQALIYIDEDGDGRSYWNDVATAGIGAWRKLDYRLRRELEAKGQQPQFLAEAGAWDLPDGQRQTLVQLGLETLDEADRDVLEGIDFASWLAARTFVQAHGSRLLAGAYHEAYASSELQSVQVDRPASEGRLYGPGTATISAEGSSVSLQGVAVQRDGAWVFQRVDDLDLDALAGQLRAADGGQAHARLSAAGDDS